MTDGYTFHITCPVCGRPVDHVTNSAPTPTTTRAIIHCDTCDRDGVITVTVSMAYKNGEDTAITTSDRRREKDRERKRRERARVNA